MSHYFSPISPAEIEWRDGLPYSLQFDDIYFSKENGLEETHHVFVEGNQLISRFEALSPGEVFSIGELGFGTGLNFLYTAQLFKKHAPQGARLMFLSCEKYPLKKEDLQRALRLWPSLHQPAEALLKIYPILTPGFHTLKLDSEITLLFMLGDAEEVYRSHLLSGCVNLEPSLRHTHVNAWFLDGFSPSKNEKMWSLRLINILALLSKPGTTFATFSCARVVKEHFERAGFWCQKTKGYGKKREMFSGELSVAQESAQKKMTPWAFSPVESKPPKNVLIVGAGLAGSYCAMRLASLGVHVTLVDKEIKPGMGASGNPGAILFPNLSAYNAPLTDLMLHGFLYASPIWQHYLDAGVEGEATGLLQFVTDKERNDHFIKWIQAYPALAKFLTQDEASALSGISFKKEAIYIPKALWLNAQALCEALIQNPLIDFKGGVNGADFEYDGEHWHVEEFRAPILIVTTGVDANMNRRLKSLPIKPIRGQMSRVEASAESQFLKRPICGESHVLPSIKNQHYFGASYHLNRSDRGVWPEDTQLNLKKLDQLPLETAWSPVVTDNWAAVRASTPNYLPIVGPVPIEERFIHDFLPLAKNKNQFINTAGQYYKGLYVATGFGSRGLTTVPICIDSLIAMFLPQWTLLPRHLIEAVSPARFMIHALIKNKIKV